MRTPLVLFLGVAAACGSGRTQHGADAAPPKEACVGLECQIADCSHSSTGTPTSLSGTVFAPNGTLALYGATVYIPMLDPGPLPVGPQCDRCDPSGALPGGVIASAHSDEAGHFRLDNVPSGTDIPLIIQIGKWRRKALLPMVTKCTDNPLPAALTALPKSHLEGDLPKIAISTGDYDALDCLVRRLGVSDSEFTNDAGMGAVHLYKGNGADHVGSAALSASPSLWNNVDKLNTYDIVMLSCEGGQHPETKSQAAMNAMKAYADAGGRVFASHYHNIWIEGDSGSAAHAPSVWKDIATWDDNTSASSSMDSIDTVSNPKGMSFATWMQNVGGSTTLGQVPIDGSSFRNTVKSINPAKAEQWVYWDNGTKYPQNFQFTTPNEAAADQRCGKVVFSDMHVAGDSSSSGTFPSGCSTGPLSPQEKALAFMFFDIASCVQVVE